MQKFKRRGDAVDVDALGLVNVTTGTTIEVPAEHVAGFEGREDWEHVPDPKRVRAGKKAAETRENDEDGDA